MTFLWSLGIELSKLNLLLSLLAGRKRSLKLLVKFFQRSPIVRLVMVGNIKEIYAVAQRYRLIQFELKIMT